ncbi:hypothetical protein D3C78_1141340 [compost metagenome]
MAGGHLEAQAAVVEQQAHARLQRRDDLRVGQVDPPRIARCGIEVEPQGLAALEIDLACGEAADPQLRPLQVHQHADRLAQLALHLTHPLVAQGMVGMLAVAEVEAEQVDAGLYQPADIFAAAGRRP